MTKRLITVAFLLIGVAWGCKKDIDNPAVEYGNVEIMHHHVVNDSVLQYNKWYVINSDTMTVETLRYYLSNVQFHKSDGSIYKVPNSYYLIETSSNEPCGVSIGNIPTGNYVSMSYIIGVDSLKSTEGAQTGALDPLNNMFWNWNTGYIFLKMEGKYKNNGIANSYVYHIGGYKGNANAIRWTNVTFDTPLQVQKGHATMVI